LHKRIQKPENCINPIKFSGKTLIVNMHQDAIKQFTLWLFNIAMENGPFTDGLPMKK